MNTEPLREVRDHFSEVIDRVEEEHERLIVTRNGRAAAVREVVVLRVENRGDVYRPR